jgi:mannose-6-phosphate isomerase-like protein (cupin superfamily)
MKHVFDLNKMTQELRNNDEYWLSFVEMENFELGVLNLNPGQIDSQEPHKGNEVYFVISGNGFLNINGSDYPVTGGRAYFVPKLTPHHFHGNTEAIIAYYALD